MGLVYRGEYRNPEMVELEFEQIDKRLVVCPRRVTTAERDAWDTVQEGDVVYNLTTHKLNVYTGTAWEVVTST
jgi:hypothetical protein